MWCVLVAFLSVDGRATSAPSMISIARSTQSMFNNVFLCRSQATATTAAAAEEERGNISAAVSPQQCPLPLIPSDMDKTGSRGSKTSITCKGKGGDEVSVSIPLHPSLSNALSIDVDELASDTCTTGSDTSGTCMLVMVAGGKKDQVAISI